MAARSYWSLLALLAASVAACSDTPGLQGGAPEVRDSAGIRIVENVDPTWETPWRVVDEPVVTIDFYPTLCQIAGIEGDPPHELDGESIAPLFESSGEATLERESIFWHLTNKQIS